MLAGDETAAGEQGFIPSPVHVESAFRMRQDAASRENLQGAHGEN